MPQETSYTSRNAVMPASRKFTAGPLSMVYENGSIRYVSYRGYEVVRMIYSAVRDRNWDTIEPVILNEKISSQGNSFKIDIEVVYQRDDIDFRANYQIVGSEAGRILFEMQGEAFSSFLKNRIGFCVLHPVNECSGKICKITHDDGMISKHYFPELISPHQPFKNIRSMRWQLKDEVYARLNFAGDVFETEDQRNWTDASYKTYCTPLELPFPVQVQKGEKINQAVELVLENVKHAEPLLVEEKAALKFFLDERFNLPLIGVGKSSETNELSEPEIKLLREVSFRHYRVDVKLFEEGWEDSFLNSCNEALSLQLKLEIALHLPQENNFGPVNRFIESAANSRVSIFAIIIFQQDKKATPDEIMKDLAPLLKKHFPAAKIGGGTDAYFAELNRNRPASRDFDFLSYSINPQVHAFDNASLVETLEAQGLTVRSAREIAKGKAVHISPVTLKPRFNPNATGPEPALQPGQLPSQVDIRQKTSFCAAWTVGSIKYLSEAGANSITYYETVGRRGLIMHGTLNKDEPDSGKNEIYPVYHVFKNILEFSGGEAVKSVSNRPLQFDGLILKKGKLFRIFLANFQDEAMEVEVALFHHADHEKFETFIINGNSVLLIDFEE